MQILILAAAALAGTYARTAVGPLQEAMRISLSLSDTQMGLLQGPALALPAVLAAGPIGYAVDRHQRVRLAQFFIALTLAGSLLGAATQNYVVLLAARCIVGLGGTATWVAVMSLLADNFPPYQRGRANMMIVIAQSVGNGAAFALGGILLSHHAGADGWRWALMWLSAPVGLILAISLLLREPQRLESVKPEVAGYSALRQLWVYRATLLPVLIGLSLFGVAEGAAVTWVAPTLARRFGLGPDAIGLVMGMVLLASGLIGPIIGGLVADVCEKRGGPRWSILTICALSIVTIPPSLFALASTPALTAIGLTLFMTLATSIIVAGTTLLMILVPNQLRGLCMAILSATFLVFAFGFAPMLVTVLSTWWGGGAMIAGALATICGLSCLFGTLAFCLGIRAIRTIYPSSSATTVSVN